MTTQRGTAAPGDDAPELRRSRAALFEKLFGSAENVQMGRYVLRERIGSGAMGVVYSAHDPELDRNVAIKLIAAERDPRSASERERLVREAQAMARISHPNVVEVFDVGTVEAGVYVAMEVVDGGTLEDWLKQTPRSIDDIVAAFVQIGAGLAAAHAAGLLHRDLKPANVLVGRDGRFRVADFGLVCVADEAVASPSSPEQLGFEETVENRSLTRTGAIVGTPAFMPPEQHRGEELDPRADQYAFCASLWRALWGAPPFGRGTLHQLAQDKQHLRFAPVETSRRVPAWLDDVVRRGMQPDPDRRFASMRELLGALDRGRRGARRLRLVASASGGALLAGLVAAAFVQDATPSCDALEDDLATAWRSERMRVEAGLRGTGAVGTARAPEIMAALDDYAATLASAREASCRLDPDDPGAAARAQCFADADARWREALSLFAIAESAAVDRSSEVIDALVVPQTCLQAAGVVARDAAANARLTALTDRLASHRIAIAAGRAPDPAREIAELVAEADALGLPRVRADAELLHGRALEHEARDEEAVAAYERAYFLAYEHGLADDEHVASAKLLSILGTRMNEIDRALTWGEHAESAIERHGLPPIRRAQLDTTLCTVHERRGDKVRALELCRRAVAVAEASGDLRLLGLALSNLGGLQSRLLDHEDALQARRRAAEILAEEMSEESPFVTIARYGVGQSLADLKRFDEAEPILRDVLARFVELRGETHPHVVVVTNELAALHLERGELEQARATFALALHRARDLTAASDTVMRGEIHRNLAEVNYRLGDAISARTHAEATVVALEGPQIDDGLAEALYFLGCAAMAEGDRELATRSLRRAREAADKPGRSELRASIVFAEAQLAADTDPKQARELAARAGKGLVHARWGQAGAIESWSPAADRPGAAAWARDAMSRGLCVRASELRGER
jgi:tetratricopeptide (TPR) repeat protein